MEPFILHYIFSNVFELGHELGQSQKATRDSWTTNPMTKKTKKIFCKIDISPEVYERLLYGFLPRDMDDRWFWYMDSEKNKIHVYRSWTGMKIYEVTLEPYSNENTKKKKCSHQITEVLANNDPGQCVKSSDSVHIESLKRILFNSLSAF